MQTTYFGFFLFFKRKVVSVFFYATFFISLNTNFKNQISNFKSPISKTKQMKPKLIITAMLLLTTATNVLNAQKEHPYIPLFDTAKVWYSVQGVEFGGYYTEVLYIDYEDVLNVNDTLYYGISPYNGKGYYGCYREDTATQRIYWRDSPDYPEKLIYDFSMQEGDSMYTTAFSVPGLWLYTDSVRTETFFNKERKVYYLTNEVWDSNPVWIEGIGSLAGLPNAVSSPDLDWMGSGYLTCYYNNDTLLYQSYYGEMYGCSFEYLDIDTPAIRYVKIHPNPSNGIFTLETEKPCNVLITDITGKEIYKSPISNFKSQINISNCPQGIYFITVKTENYSITKKIIKN